MSLGNTNCGSGYSSNTGSGYNNTGSGYNNTGSGYIIDTKTNVVYMGEMDMHIRAIGNGFLLTYIQEGNTHIECYNELKDLFGRIEDLGLMTLDMSRVADNV
jgi:hypothetical protein